MPSFSSPSPPTIPLKFRRKSSSASTSVSMDSHAYKPGDAAPSSSPLLSSSPLRLSRRYEWQASDYLDDLDGVPYNQRDKVDIYPWTRHPRPEQPLPNIHPPLMTKVAAHTLQSCPSLSYSPSPSSVPQTTYFYPQGDSAIADDGEEYDLESLDIHIRETYFATSSERGRWLSSPIAPRARSQAIPPMRGHSSPIKPPADASPMRERARGRKRSCSVDILLSTSSSADQDEGVRCSSSLPPSSPPTSPMSNLSFLCDDCEDDFVGDPRSNSDDCHSFTGTPELSISSTTCTSPFEPMHTSILHEAPVIVSALHPTDFPCRSLDSAIPRHTSPCPSHSPKPVDVHVHAPSVASFELDDVPSPPSQLESNFPEAAPSKLPLSDTVNKPYPGQRITTSGATVGAVQSQDGPSCIQSLSTDSTHESSDKRAKRRRGSTAGNAGARRTKKRALTQSGSTSSDTKKRDTGDHAPNRSEPPSKQSKLPHCKDNSGSRGAKSLSRRGGIPKVERLSRSPSRPVVEGCGTESACPHDRKMPRLTDHVQLQRPTPNLMDAIDAEFHVSLTGMLIEALATSRATSMDSAALYLVVMQAHPYLAGKRSKEELLTDIVAVLEAGRTRCGMFEKVDSSGERSRHKALESRWFYIPERDHDPERASLISALMPRQKRNETKKYKQYYYRPLDKMSRWDPEDAP